MVIVLEEQTWIGRVTHTLRQKTTLSLFLVIILTAGFFVTFAQLQTSHDLRNFAAAPPGGWAFEENFDEEGAPTAPLPYSDPQKFQFVVTSNDPDGVVDGQTVDATETVINPPPPMDMAHGPHCQPPIGNADPANNVHTVDVNGITETQFQTQIRPQMIYICNFHMMTSIKSGYGLISMMPRQYFDFANRTGTIEFDNNVYGFGREWFDLYLVPEEDMLQSMAIMSEGGTLEQHPRTAVKFSFKDATPQMYFIDNYDNNDSTTRIWRNGYRFKDAFPNDPAPNDPKIRRTFRFQISQTSWKYQVQVDPATAPSSPPTGSYETIDGKQFWTFTGTFPKTLPFSKVLMRFEHHSYNPTKDGIFGTPWSQYTYHWDNIHFDGPILPAPTAFDPTSNAFIKMWGAAPGTVSTPMHFNVNVPQAEIKNAKIIGEMASSLNRGEVDFANNSHWRQFRVNGGSWQDMTLVKNVDCGCDRTWSTFRNSFTGLVSGDNTVEFKYATTPSGKTWQPDGFNIKDVEIQIDPVNVPTPTPCVGTACPTATPTSTPTPTPLPTAAPTPIPAGSLTVTFDDVGSLSGQYPTGVLDWSGQPWILSNPFGAFTTKSASFTQGPTTATINVLQGRTLLQLEAYNGGTSTTVSISCPGNTTKTQVIPASQLVIIQTGFTQSCSTLTISSTNGWDTNFDNLFFSAANSVNPTLTPPNSTPTPTPTVSPFSAGDINHDNKINVQDLSYLLSHWGSNDLLADLNHNGIVNTLDLSILLAAWRP